MRKLLFTIILNLSFTNLSATTQHPERIIIGQDTLYTDTAPFDRLDSARYKQFLRLVDKANTIKQADSSLVFIRCSALWRGYIATWEIRQDSLIFREAENVEGHPADLRKICCNGDLADWFTGDIRIGRGKILLYGDGLGEDDTIFEYETCYSFQNGIVIRKQEIHNQRYGDSKSFGKALSAIGNDFRFPANPAPELYRRIFVSFSYRPSSEGKFETFEKVCLLLLTLDGQEMEINDPKHPYLLELQHRLREIEPYGAHYRGKSEPVHGALRLGSFRKNAK